MLSETERRFLAICRVAHLATVDYQLVPHVVPVCFAVADRTLYITIDEKPKRTASGPLKRITNIQQNPKVAVVADRYDEDWSRLGWVILRGCGEILEGGNEHGLAQDLLRSRYHQLHQMQIARLKVIAVRIERVTSWGNLSI